MNIEPRINDTVHDFIPATKLSFTSACIIMFVGLFGVIEEVKASPPNTMEGISLALLTSWTGLVTGGSTAISVLQELGIVAMRGTHRPCKAFLSAENEMRRYQDKRI